MKQHYLIKISYDGTSFHGWQRLKNDSNTIQQIIENILGTPIRGSGRTDAGVHAYAQYADFFYDTIADFEKFISDCNEKLPKSIQIRSIQNVRENFHSRKDAYAKTYCYQIALDGKPDVFYQKYCYHLTETPLRLPFEDRLYALDYSAMKQAANYLTGTHDFSAFTSDKSTDKSHIRTITSIEFDTRMLPSKKQILTISFTGNGFLYNMVRILAGTILLCGIGQLSADEISAILVQKERSLAGPTLPPQGLYLKNVYYDI